MCKELLIPPGTQNYVVRMRLYDTNKHLLCLTIRIILRAQGALKILISAPYWLVNKTGNRDLTLSDTSAPHVILNVPWGVRVNTESTKMR